jgi:hypothetical protein
MQMHERPNPGPLDRKGFVTDVSGPQRNTCPGTLRWWWWRWGSANFGTTAGVYIMAETDQGRNWIVGRHRGDRYSQSNRTLAVGSQSFQRLPRCSNARLPFVSPRVHSASPERLHAPTATNKAAGVSFLERVSTCRKLAFLLVYLHFRWLPAARLRLRRHNLRHITRLTQL